MAASYRGVGSVIPPAASISGVHPKLNAEHLQSRMDVLGCEMLYITGLIDHGALRFAERSEFEACRDAVARIADAVLGLAQTLDRAERTTL